ncbi:MAG: hypothetical protein ACOC0V_01100 [Oceanicaulis sp.]
MKKLALTAVAATLAFGGAAVAQTWDDRDDKDETASMTADEDVMFDSRLQQAFSAIDMNDDDMISYEEWGNWQADDGFYAERFDMFDGDGDDMISWEEYREATHSLYDTSNLTD